MEKSPQENDQVRPRLDIDLSGPDGNVFMVIGMARQQLDGEALKDFNRMIWEATQVGSGKQYADILAIVNAHMDLTDVSGMYEAYAPKPLEPPQG